VNVPAILEGFMGMRMGVAAVPVFGALRGVVLSATFEQRRVALRGFVDVDSSSLIARALRPGGVPSVFTLDADRAFVGAVHIDPELAGEVFDAVVFLDRNEPTEARRELSQELGVDVEKELFPALSGDLGLLVRREARAGQNWPSTQLTLAIGLRDGAAGKRLLPRIAPNMPKRVTTVVVHDELVMTEQPQFLGPMGRDEAPRMPKGLGGTDILTNSPAGVLRIDAEMLVEDLFGYGYYEKSAVAMPMAATLVAAPTPNEGAAVVTARAKLEALEEQTRELDARYHALEVDARRQERKMIAKTVHAFGSTLIAIRPVEGGFEVVGGQYHRERDAAALVDRAFSLGTGLEKQADAFRRKRVVLERLRAMVRSDESVARSQLQDLLRGEQSGGVAKPVPR